MFRQGGDMKRDMKLVAAATVAAILAGCASGGGGGGTSRTGDGGLDEFASALLCVYSLGFACTQKTAKSSGSSSSASAYLSLDDYLSGTYLTPTNFTRWSAAPRDRYAEPYGPKTNVDYSGQFDSVAPAHYQVSERVYMMYDDNHQLYLFGDLPDGRLFTNLSQAAHEEIDVVLDGNVGSYTQSPFTSAASSIAIVANPYIAGWDYQSFGVWNTQAPGGDGGTIGAHSFGAATPASAVPLSGAANFVGKLGGLYISPAGEGSTGAADVTVNADFSTRSLSFASSNTVTMRNLATAMPAPNLNLSGTLNYASGSNTFSGTLTSAGGTMSGTSNGQFYGPNAEELGGVFVVKSPTTVETFTGAYGAKR
jgi:hypothetical protein